MACTNEDERKVELAAKVLDELEACSIVHQSAEELQALEEFPDPSRAPRAPTTERELTLGRLPAE